MESSEIRGVRWPNISIVEDQVTEEVYCEIHLRIGLNKPGGNAKDAVTAENVRYAIEEDRKAGDKALTKLKVQLHKALGRTSEGNKQLVNALTDRLE
ncbi:MAG: hypothetical protein H0T48_02600 [Gemmatimonadaceae bacterium]|nr:hypothetical protein [Gemmatimonadaceae bacterium]